MYGEHVQKLWRSRSYDPRIDDGVLASTSHQMQSCNACHSPERERERRGPLAANIRRQSLAAPYKHLSNI